MVKKFIPKENLTVPCSCQGANPNCFKCGGWGYIDSIGKGRSDPSGPMISKGGVVQSRARKRKKSSFNF